MSTYPGSVLEHLRRLCRHAAWADDEIQSALRACSTPNAAALREYGHVVAAEEVWLARLEQRASRVSVWPSLDLATASALSASVREGYASFLDRLEPAAVSALVAYVNTAGQSFTTPIDDILVHCPGPDRAGVLDRIGEFADSIIAGR